ncbi:NAD(P)-dependent alcohol dehydrogenase [Amycolatopsis jejuensis]|uniref:NAD(P)-dependent alcohol dehydrogenase n=1 Tax=Amycolatopsis jejuensis TaxID=330084 RepID=UPI0005243F7D|nr:NAD(P)-dependent alcohol dehydrogenase [Amycolatopsis jejuensis]
MRAALHDRYGPPSVLYQGQLPIPAVGDQDVLVRVTATTVNGGDLLMRAGRLRLVTGRKFPRMVGIDFVGEVVKAGAGVDIGDRVWGAVDERRREGAAAEYVAVPAGNVAPAPKNLSDTEAVTLLAGGTVALTGLQDKTRLARGERLLVRGANGGVGSIAVQLGKHLGAHVTALSRSADFVRGLGADEVFDYSAQLGTFDVIFDTHGTELPRFRKLLTENGRMATIAFDLRTPVRSIGYLAASTISGRVRFFRAAPSRARLDQLADLAERGALRPVVHRVFDLSEIAAAHEMLEAGGVHGKVVLQVGK